MEIDKPILRSLFLVLILFSNTFAQVIHDAVRRSDIAKIESIIDEDSDAANLKDANGRIPLRFTDNPEIIKLLINKGADPFIKDNRGRSVLKFLMNYALRFPSLREQKKAALTAYIESGTKFPSRGDEGKYFLHSAALIGHEKLFSQIIENNVDINSLNNSEGTLLHSAAFGGLTEVTEKLIKGGLDINAKNRYGQTPVMLAAMEGHKNVVSELIENDADLNIKSDAGKNAADYALDFGHDEIISLLKKYGVEAGAKKFTNLIGSYLGQKEPGTKPELFGKGIISSIHYDHSSPIFSKDGKEVYWSEVYTSRGDFIHFMKEENGKWTVPEILPFCHIGGTYMYPTLSEDNKKLFFTSDRALDGNGSGDQMNIWYTEKTELGWSEPIYIGFDKGHEYGLTIAENGNLYFMAFYDGGFGSADLYVSKYIKGKYSEPKNLGEVINTGSYEDEPYIAPDESYLIFASNKPTENNEGRFYISYKNADGAWKDPENISSKIEIDGDIRFPHISPDGKYFFFASDQNGNWDIYWMKFDFIIKNN